MVQGDEYYGCIFLNLISEIPVDAERVVKHIQKQKNGIRNLFSTILEPIGKEDLADEMYSSSKVHLLPIRCTISYCL
jgi:hypothetical protein